MNFNTYYAPTGGLPPQTELTTNRAVFTEAYAVLPRGTMRDIVTSLLPFWTNTRLESFFSSLKARSAKKKRMEPSAIARQLLNEMMNAKPTPTGESHIRPLVARRVPSSTRPAMMPTKAPVFADGASV